MCLKGMQDNLGNYGLEEMVKIMCKFKLAAENL